MQFSSIKSQVISKEPNQIKRAKLITDKFLRLTLLPTEQCNFRCTYCYEDYFERQMKPEIVTGIKLLIERRLAKLETLVISWFGGEPLIAKNIMLDISRYAKSLIDKGNRKINFISGATTNGYFLDLKTASELAEVGICDYQISLDGPKDLHNQTRLRGDGTGTFDRIWSNLIAIRDSSLPISINLRIHFTSDTYNQLNPLLNDLRREFLPDPRFSFYFEGIHKLGGENDSNLKIFTSVKEERQIAESLKAKLYQSQSYPKRSSELGSYICYAAKGNAFIVRSNGDICKCTVALYDERNKIATLQPDGTLDIIPGRITPWMRGIETLDRDALSCPWANLTWQ